MYKKHFIIAGTAVAITWTGTGIWLYLKLDALKRETRMADRARKRANDIMLDRIRRGDYIGKPNEDVETDFRFFIMGERLDEEG